MDEKKKIKMPHNVIMEDRKLLSITGVTDIDSFDENTIIVYTELGELVIRGTALHINKIDVETGELSVEGELEGLSYNDNQPNRGGLFTKLFR